MAKQIIDGREFEIPDNPYSGKELQRQAGLQGNAMPVVRREGKDNVIEPDEVIQLGPTDRVFFTTPMTTG